MPYKVTLFLDLVKIAEQEIPGDYIDTSYDEFDVRLDPTPAALSAGLLHASTYVKVQVQKI